MFPRTQYIQLQEEYWNVGVAFELFKRAFGELDVIHEEQIKDSTMNGYQILVMCDIKLLPREAAGNIIHFVQNGGTVIADQVPRLGKFKEPMDLMTAVFAEEGMRTVGSGRTFLVKPRLLDAYFQAWKANDPAKRRQWVEKISGMAQKAGVRFHVFSSNPDIEAAVRANANEGFLFVISHEPAEPQTTIRLADLPFEVGRAIDLTTDKNVPFQREGPTVIIKLSAPAGSTHLIQLRP